MQSLLQLALFLMLSRTAASFPSIARRAMSSLVTNAVSLTYHGQDDVPADTETTVWIGKKDSLQSMLDTSSDLSPEDKPILTALLDAVKEKSTVSSFLPNGHHTVALGLLPETVSRHNHPLSVHTITSLIASSCTSGNAHVIFTDETDSPAALASAVAKAFPLYSRKTNGKNDNNNDNDSRTIHISFSSSQTTPQIISAAQAVSDSVRLAARLADMPPAELTTDAYAAECRAVADQFPDTVTYHEIGGTTRDNNEALKPYGGLYGVGQAATCPPRLVILEYTPRTNDPHEHVALVGKGIVYDTGGLSLKPKTGMGGMKHDMGGSAGMLGAFAAACRLETPRKITLLMCLAENAIGPEAFRNDDILTMYSGKTVEVNNCDAEGRLVLADGVAHATKHLEGLDLVVDMATLTGAQMVTTGQKHAGILANTEQLEQRAVRAGLHSGDLCYPMLYCPELLKEEFNSKVADMKNSVKDRGNAQASCAGHFIEAHLDEDYKGGWLHIDMAGPSTQTERGTGYGVGLILSLLEAPGF